MSPSSADSRETNRLLDQAAQGDRQAFDRLFQHHRKSIRHLITLRLDERLKTRLDASDIVQETQMVAFRRFQEFMDRRPMPFRLWLRKLAQQQVYHAQRNHINRRRRSLLREEGPLNRSSMLVARGLLTDRSTPIDKLARRELQRRVAGAVAALADRDREIVVMRNAEGLTFEEIAQVLDIEAPTVRQRYGRALFKLRAKLKDSGLSE
jgi:RNA polymerase sigma-70 factor (ECF subfamily)